MTSRPTERRDAIVAVARRTFTTLGYDGTTIGNIANELDISKAAIAYYFPTKDTFLDEFVPPFLEALETGVETATDARAALSGYLTALTKHHDVAVWMDTDPVLQGHPVHGARLAGINQRTIAVVTAGSRKQKDHVRALGVLGGLWRPVRELEVSDLEALHEEIVEAALASY